MRNIIRNLIVVVSVMVLAGLTAAQPIWQTISHQTGFIMTPQKNFLRVFSKETPVAPVWGDTVKKETPRALPQDSYLKVYSEARVYNDADVPQVARVAYTIYSEAGASRSSSSPLTVKTPRWSCCRLANTSLFLIPI
jgi:hypothetical protein